MIRKEFGVICDFCYDEFPDDRRGPETIREVRSMAKEAGWIYKKGGDICPRCQNMWG